MIGVKSCPALHNYLNYACRREYHAVFKKVYETDTEKLIEKPIEKLIEKLIERLSLFRDLR